MCYCEFLMLHSTRPTRFPFFTFQNVSINTERTGISETAVHPSRFHYVSIITRASKTNQHTTLLNFFPSTN